MAQVEQEQQQEDGGWELEETIVKLQFMDPSFDGLQVRAYEATNDVVSAIAEFHTDDDRPLSAEDRQRAAWVRDQFAEALVSWNLRRRGKAVPATEAAVRRLPQAFLWQLITGWVAGTRQVTREAAARLETQLRDAAAVDEADLPMDS